jgi:hypothetical protein
VDRDKYIGCRKTKCILCNNQALKYGGIKGRCAGTAKLSVSRVWLNRPRGSGNSKRTVPSPVGVSGFMEAAKAPSKEDIIIVRLVKNNTSL